MEVLLERHGGGHYASPAAAWDQNLDFNEQRERLWPVETERIWVQEHYAGEPQPRDLSTHWQDPADNHGRYWRLWEPGSDFRRGITELPYDLRDVWVQTSPVIGESKLPGPEWPANNNAAGPAPHLGGPFGTCLPAKIKGWAKCGGWRGPFRNKHSAGQTSSSVRYWGCPVPWEERGVVYHDGDDDDPGGRPILRGVPVDTDTLDTFLLMLCHDGSHGLDLSFVTHLFIVNQIEDPAVYRQVVARAHRMGAMGPVTVQTLRLWHAAVGANDK